MLQQKANFFAKELHILNFDCSALTVSRVDTANLCRFNRGCNRVANLRAKFSDDKIFNAGETGIFYRLTSDKTLKYRGERYRQIKGSKMF